MGDQDPGTDRVLGRQPENGALMSDDAVSLYLDRRNTITLSNTERRLYLELNGTTLSSAVRDHPVE